MCTTVDVPVQFDRSRNSWGWTANRGIVSTIAENASQVLDVSYKYRICPQCKEMKKRRKMGNVNSRIPLEYNWYVAHESKSFFNHEGRP